MNKDGDQCKYSVVGKVFRQVQFVYMTLELSIPQLYVAFAPPVNFHFVPFTNRQQAKSPSIAFATATFGSLIVFACLGRTSNMLQTIYVADSRLQILKAEQQFIPIIVELHTSPNQYGPLIELEYKQMRESSPHLSYFCIDFQSALKQREARTITTMAAM